MDDNQKAELVNILKESVNFNVAMNSYSTFRVGGKAEAICFIHELNEFKRLLSFLNSEIIPWMVIGRGSNLLVTDKGINGVVMILKGKLADVREEDNNILAAGGGLSITRLLKYCVQQGLSGMEFMSGIPGTLGGAVIMNAGAYGKEIGEQILNVGIVNSEGETKEMKHSQIPFAYRKASMPEKSIIYSVTIKLKKDKRELIKERIENNLNERKETQPLDLPSCGSVFKNPDGDYAGRLIEQCGLKGKCIGGAMVSPKHANYIVNTGNARSSQILELMEHVKRKVRDKTGIMLEPEIRVVGI